MRPGPYCVVVTKGLLTVPNRAAGSSSLRPAAAQIDRLDAATRAKSSWFNAAAVARNLEPPFERMYRRCQTGLPLHQLTVEQRAPAPCAAPSAELCL
jgi:hypothetical protein